MEYNKNKPLRVLTAFSGYDSQMMALQRLKDNFPDFDFVCVGWSEIDENAIIAHNACFPNEKNKNYGDISKIDWDKVPDFDLFTYSFPCFVAGTLVITEKGLKPIEDISVGDRVLTHNRVFKDVIRTMAREYGGEIVKINAMPIDGIVCTPNHPFYTRERYWENHSGKRVRLFRTPKWTEAGKLTSDTYIGVAVNDKSEYPLWNGTTDNRWGHNKPSNKLSMLFDKGCFWYVMGRYVGDGWKRSDGSGIIICCGGRNEDKLKEQIEQCGFSYTSSTERTIRKYHICLKELCCFVERYGYFAHGKKIDSETINLPADMLKSFIEGYIDSDGNLNGKYHVLTSVSRELIYGISQCVAKVYRMPYRIYKCERKKTTVIEGRVVNQRDSYSILWKDDVCKQDKAFYENGYIWFPIKRISTFEKKTIVYNLEVKDDNSYTANGVIVHNCTDISASGKQAGLEEGSGTRSSLLWECRKAIVAKHPRYLLMENVKALACGKFVKYLNKWQTFLHTEGYENFTQILNAKDYGVPQNRERVFMVSILRTEEEPNPSYYFPKPFKLETRIKDVLEQEVDESFYLSDKALEYFCRVNNDTSHGHNFTPKDGGDIAFTVRCASGQRVDDNFLKYEE